MTSTTILNNKSQAVQLACLVCDKYNNRIVVICITLEYWHGFKKEQHSQCEVTEVIVPREEKKWHHIKILHIQ